MIPTAFYIPKCLPGGMSVGPKAVIQGSKFETLERVTKIWINVIAPPEFVRRYGYESDEANGVLVTQPDGTEVYLRAEVKAYLWEECGEREARMLTREEYNALRDKYEGINLPSGNLHPMIPLATPEELSRNSECKEQECPSPDRAR